MSKGRQRAAGFSRVYSPHSPGIDKAKARSSGTLTYPESRPKHY
jgi:hypothetical protein